MRHFWLKKTVKTFVLPVLDVAGIFDQWLSVAGARQPFWMILMYHRVISDPRLDPFRLGMCVSRENFERQMAYFAKNFVIRQMRDVIRSLERGEALPPRLVSITFDDGYQDNLTNAMPVLRRYGIPMSLYVATDGLEENRPFWWDRVIRILHQSTLSAIDLYRIGLTSAPQEFTLSRFDRGESAMRFLSLLWGLPGDGMLKVVDRLEREYDGPTHGATTSPRLSRDEIRALHREGVEIGAHSCRHPNLATLDKAQAITEMADSKRYLETLLGEAVDGFAYPGGRMTPETGELACARGFRYALSTKTAVNRSPYSLFDMPRIGIPDSRVADVKRCLSRIAMRHVAP
jgi:peptidoglycan/xylan/chitin deacetylase (PgdA/CDA1 family)